MVAELKQRTTAPTHLSVRYPTNKFDDQCTARFDAETRICSNFKSGAMVCVANRAPDQTSVARVL
jgi:hypothetical protein